MRLNNILDAVRSASNEYAVSVRKGACFIILPNGMYPMPEPDGKRLKGNYLILKYNL